MTTTSADEVSVKVALRVSPNFTSPKSCSVRSAERAAGSAAKAWTGRLAKASKKNRINFFMTKFVCKISI